MISKNIDSPKQPKEKDKNRSSKKTFDNLVDQEKSEVFKSSWWENPPLNPIEKALIEGKTIAYYIPSENADFYQLWALQSLGQWVELLKDKKELSKEEKELLIHPKYKFVIGKESPGYNGDINEQGRVIINFRGSARLG